MKRSKPIVIGVAGGSGSGKTTVTREIYRSFSDKSITVIQQDAYYKAQDDKPFEERLLTNYDHPLAFDTDLLISHIQELLQFHPIKKPVYDYTVHTRSAKIVPVEPKDVIILEGILILEDERLRNLMDIKVFVDTDSDLRIIRRLLRDTEERGRSVESVINQYLTAVRPMHLQFVEPTKRYADIIIPEGGKNSVAIDLMATKIRTVLEGKDSQVL
ncbi:uridine kinase [Sporolactobacillus laevolacticus]|uniref:Uridine kinase n=1 Tax=Sporolactobacillus laevolacticus DSM 442 TaxID=1395513 RepID=V6J0R7_9BACL|nr:uridine kinase [Sporolactobacillus laevolacticus]EST13405.1 uridine/cytidine kinase [Sporolactobacillus laevolacticus DSM 442]MDN3955463.1 uridine kinase [Sporolactobacillus laevolacticus]